MKQTLRYASRPRFTGSRRTVFRAKGECVGGPDDARARSTAGADLAANQPSRQQEVAAQLGVSVIQVREALVTLEAEGLVTISPNRGAAVASLSMADATEIYLIRIALERLALAHAIPAQSDREWRQADRLLGELDSTGDARERSELSWAFHALLYNPPGMPRLMAYLRNLNYNVARYFVVHDLMGDRAAKQHAHRALLGACRARDANQACDLLEAHLRASVAVLRAHLR